MDGGVVLLVAGVLIRVCVLVAVVAHPHLGVAAEPVAVYQESAIAAEDLAAYPAVVFPPEGVEGLAAAETVLGALVLHPVLLREHAIVGDLVLLAVVVKREQKALRQGRGQRRRGALYGGGLVTVIVVAVWGACVRVLHGHWAAIPDGDGGDGGLGRIDAGPFQVGVVLDGQLQRVRGLEAARVPLDGVGGHSTGGLCGRALLTGAGLGVRSAIHGHVTRASTGTGTAGARQRRRRADLWYRDVAQDRVGHQVRGGGRGGRGHYVEGRFLDVVWPGLRNIGGVYGGRGG